MRAVAQAAARLMFRHISDFTVMNATDGENGLKIAAMNKPDAIGRHSWIRVISFAGGQSGRVRLDPSVQ